LLVSNDMNAKAFYSERELTFKIGAKFVSITNRKSHMSFRLVPNSVTLDDLERRNSPNGRVIHRIW